MLRVKCQLGLMTPTSFFTQAKTGSYGPLIMAPCAKRVKIY